jgi:membrane protein YqaA with SNARE-associated domain
MSLLYDAGPGWHDGAPVARRRAGGISCAARTDVGTLLRHIANGLVRLGPAGLILLSAADSSFLVLPLGNDLLVIVLSAHRPDRWLLYAILATFGSVIGCFLTAAATLAGEARLEKKIVPPKRLRFLKYQVEKRVGWVLALACLMPPPFPFTPFVAGAAAFRYPMRKLLSIVAIARLIRFGAGGLLGILYGPSILSFTQTPFFTGLVYALVVIAIGGSAWSIYRWTKASPAAK